jgi:crotonobetainyl-CoA:carnitine CoA-transferase CaiB-like acyl-CoA transferase
MAGVWDGIDVLDLSWGVAGPIASMMLADNGARVTKVEPPAGDPFRGLSGYRVWGRGKRSAVLDLHDRAERDHFLALAAVADVVIESFSPGTTTRLGIDYDTLTATNSRLVYCSITGYGTDTPDADRPAYDALVAARTGLQWESRGVIGGTTSRLSGTAPILPDFDVPVDRWEGPPRDGPMFAGVPWPSIGAAHIAHLSISAALRARQITGRGQRIDTSLLRGALASGAFAWARAERADSPGYESWLHDPRATKGYFKCADGRWVHQWTPVPGFVAAGAGDTLQVTDEVKAGLRDGRVGVVADQLPRLQAVVADCADTYARFSSSEWEKAAAEAGISVQTVRSPEEALADPLLVADGCVAEVADPELGLVRQVGQLIRLGNCRSPLPGPAPRPGQHTAEVLAAVADRRGQVGGPITSAPAGSLRHPLEGIRVVDFSLAVAGPFGAQLLAELGADVIKVNAVTPRAGLNRQMHGMCERSKRSIAVDLKDPEGLAIFHRLVQQADVAATNMRQAAVARLGLDYEALRRVNPAIIYCHTRGHENGPRKNLVGHDQSAAAIAGVTWLEGGLDDGGRPHWPSISIGDTGNGFLWAAAVVQALYHRDRTGEGQMVDTAIVNAHLLNASMAWMTADGSVVADRQRLDGMALGWSALYRLYPAADGWLCLAAVTEQHWSNLCAALRRRELLDDPLFATSADRATHDRQLVHVLESAFADQPVEALWRTLDECGVPCEVSSPDSIVQFFNDPSVVDRQWLTSFNDPVGGLTTAIGLLADFSETPGKVWGPPLVVGDHTRDILGELGYDTEQIDKLCAQGTVADAGDTTP